MAPDRAMDPQARGTRVALAAWLLLAVVTTAPFLRAQLSPPPGTRFMGTFFYWDDFYQYLSFVEQATHGDFFFLNKFDTRPHDPLFVNLEWWAAGGLGALLGGRPLAGFHLLRLLALGGLVAAAARFLSLAGLTGSRLRWAIVLFATGGGLGWLRFWMGQKGGQIPDLRAGLYPWHQALSNPHMLVGTALLLWTVLLHLEWRQGRRGRAGWLACGWALGLSRPFDLGTFILIAVGLAVIDALHRDRRRLAVEHAAALLWFLPVVAYQTLVLRAHPSYGLWSGPQNVVPPFPFIEYFWALAPAMLIAALGSRAPQAPGSQPQRRTLVVWCAVLGAVIVLSGTSLLPSFAVQQISTLGAALLLLAALVTTARWLPLATLASIPTAAMLFASVFSPGDVGFPPDDYFAVVDSLKPACRPGDRVLAPADVGLLVAGLTPCSVTVGHRVLTPDYARRVDEVGRLYSDDTPGEARRALVRRSGARFAVLPAGAESWLSGEPFARRLSRPSLEVWEALR